MAVADGETLTVVKDMGLVPNVFDDRTLVALTGDLAIGHTRYSTTGSSTLAQRPARLPRRGQPRVRPRPQRQPHQHRGAGRRARHAARASCPATATSWPSCWPATSATHGGDLDEALAAVLPTVEGAFSLVLLDGRRLVRRPRPERLPAAVPRPARRRLGAGQRDAGARHRRRPLRARARAGRGRASIDADGPRSFAPVPGRARSIPGCACSSSCTSPGPTPSCTAATSTPPGCGWASSSPRRRRCRPTARMPARPAMVMPVPESGVPAAQGFARASGIPYGDGLVKNRYIGRTFIAPSQELRAHGVRMKLNPLRENIEGKRLVVVDDSIVRGTTTRAVVAMLREAGRRRGAPADHVAALPLAVLLRHGHRRSRRAAGRAASTVDEIRDFVGADTLAYLDLERLRTATGVVGAPFCDACLTGDYPVRRAGHAAQGRARGPWLSGRSSGQSRAATRAAGVSLDAADEAVDRIKAHARSTFRPEVLVGHRRLRRPRGRARRLPRAGAGQLHRRRGHEAEGGRGGRPVRHHRHRPRGHVRRRHRRAGRRPAVLPRLRRRRRLDPGVVEDDRGRRGRRLPAGRLRAGRRRDGRARRGPRLDLAGFAVGVVERSALLTGEAHRAPATCSSASPSPGLRSNGYSLARQVLLPRAELLDDPAWDGADVVPGRRAAAPVGHLLAGAWPRCGPRCRVHGFAHITGGGLPGNLARVLPAGRRRRRAARARGRCRASSPRCSGAARSPTTRWREVFNLGVGMVAVVGAAEAAEALACCGRPVSRRVVIGEVVGRHGLASA